MTFDPQHDYESMASAKARLGGFQQPSPCPCHLCRMYELAAGPVLVPWTQRMPDGSRRRTGRWLHGIELRQNFGAKRKLGALMESFSGYAMGER